MTPKLRVSHNAESLDPNALIPQDMWEEFTTLYIQGIEKAVRQDFPDLELDVASAFPGDQTDWMECNCHCADPCVHETVLYWLRQEDNWLRGLNHALRKLERRPRHG